MATRVLRFANILLAGLVAGTVFGIWLGYNPASLSASAYIEQQQNAIRALNVIMPVLGAICIVLTIAHALLLRSNRLAFYVLSLGTVFLIVGGLVTRFGNQPINAVAECSFTSMATRPWCDCWPNASVNTATERRARANRNMSGTTPSFDAGIRSSAGRRSFVNPRRATSRLTL